MSLSVHNCNRPQEHTKVTPRTCLRAGNKRALTSTINEAQFLLFICLILILSLHIYNYSTLLLYPAATWIVITAESSDEHQVSVFE